MLAVGRDRRLLWRSFIITSHTSHPVASPTTPKLHLLQPTYSQIQMSEGESESRREKTREEYSRNVKKLKIKLAAVQGEIVSLERRVDSLANTSNDKLISMKIAKFCKERRFTPEMLFRFADRTGARSVSKLHFQDTLTQLGLKLSKDEFLRLEYLIDEDLSGEISYAEYAGYLQAFGIKKEFSASDQLARDVLQKLDVRKVLQIAEENGQDSDRKRPAKHANLLNYEQFIKYCHKHFPGLKNKELAAIFNRLEKNQLINLQDLVDYLEGQEAEKKRLEEKNKKRLKREDSKIRPVAEGQRTLKGIIEALLRCRLKESTIVFHSLQFVRLERVVGAKRGQLLQIFQDVDHKRRGSYRGSFTHNELINYFIEKSEKSEDLPYAFELMAHKLAVLKQSPEAIVSQYASRPDFLTEQELKKFFEGEFDVAFQEYNIIARLVPREQEGRYSVDRVVDLLRRDGKRMVTIKPNSFTGRLVFRNARLAVRCCLELEEKLAQLKQPRWHDFEFGPTETDEFGSESINLPMPSEQVDWLPCDQIGMAEFFREDLDASYTCSPVCPNETFTKTLFSLVTANPGVLWSSDKVDAGVRGIEECHLNQIFTGIYPLAFHSFAKYGIFVLRLFVKEQWRYVLIDSKVPCAPDKTPFFSSVTGHRFSFMALIEKAYAKALGNYHAVYANANPHQYLIELANLLPLEYAFQKATPDAYKNLIWEGMVKFQKDETKAVKEGKSKKARSMFAVMRTRNEDSSKELPLHIPFRIEEVVEIPDSKCKNAHKSHRLLLVRTPALRDESSWNKSWGRDEAGNKYAQMSLQVADKLSQPSLLKNKTLLLINYKLFRSLFAFYHPESVNFADMIILRKELLFEEKFKCRYEITAKSELEFVIVLAQRSMASDARIVFEAKGAKEQVLWRQARREQVAVRTVRVEKGQGVILELSVENWKSDVEYRYSLTFYMRHPRYELKQRDRHMLFRYVSPYEEEPKMDFSDYEGAERQFIYRNFYRAAERRGCCG